ncbi:exopolysaccharide production repressor protein [Mesorhizobium sp. AR07]|uniref:exopolysaccharide production repressor protein n=1 Tax=Mesorhizobium sp. AR07 TaxID=2865838 RepID=UPI00215EADDA|nr:exopolysaccharide production repressor protein [Mesorhizobium sp. AR07]UVK47554.1 exopolysaccharide production repressor protein [Mesorhizobium sp. AR07]
MYFPQFLVGMLTTAVVVAAWAYLDTGSIMKGVIWGVIAAVVLQVGYFALVFRLVYRGRRNIEQEAGEITPESQQTAGRPEAATALREAIKKG